MNLQTPPLCPKCGQELAPQKINLVAEIAAVISQRPELTYKAIAEQFGISSRTVKRYARRAGIKRRKGAK
jgi:DNA invertase Pin-like site-specific DNA recombinase